MSRKESSVNRVQKTINLNFDCKGFERKLMNHGEGGICSNQTCHFRKLIIE